MISIIAALAEESKFSPANLLSNCVASQVKVILIIHRKNSDPHQLSCYFLKEVAAAGLKF
jgi:hypothetical protein